MHREVWFEKLNDKFKDCGLRHLKYEKNLKDIYALVDEYGDVNFAIKNAKRRMLCYDDKTDKPSAYDPGTTVYKLVEELRKYIVE